MQRTTGAFLIAGLLALAACTPDEDVSEDTAVPTGSSGSGTAAESTATDDSSPASTSVEPTEEVALPGLLDPSDEPIPNDDLVRTGTLENGLQYYVRYNDRPGAKASLRLAIDAGSVDETGPSTGVAHFVEHMLFNGTEQFPENELIDVLRSFGAAFGADINAYTSFDETVYELEVPNDAESLDTGMTVLDQWLSHATFDPAQVEAERGIVTDEWRTSTQDVSGRLFEVAQGMYLAGTPYEHRDPIGSAESIATVPVEELRQFYDNWYRPDNAAVVVVGDVDVDATVADIEQRFGSAVPRTEAMPARPDTTFPIETEPDFALHSDPDQTTVDVEVDLPIPAIESDGTAALRADILDSMIYSALIRRLDQDVSAGDAAFDDITTGTNSFVSSLDAPALYAITTADRVDATLQALLDEYERTDRFGFSEAETDVAKAAAQAEFDSLYDGRNTTQDVDYADQYVANFLTGTPFPHADDLYENATATIEAITPEALDRAVPGPLAAHGAARHHLDTRAGGGRDAERSRGAGDDRRHRRARTVATRRRTGAARRTDGGARAGRAGVTRRTARPRRSVLRSDRDRLRQRRPRARHLERHRRGSGRLPGGQSRRLVAGRRGRRRRRPVRGRDRDHAAGSASSTSPSSKSCSPTAMPASEPRSRPTSTRWPAVPPAPTSRRCSSSCTCT